MERLKTEVLVVGGGTGGTAAAIQAARRGAQTILVSEFSWLGGMLTAAGVSAPDGNELAAFQTGLWGAFIQELQQRQPEGLDHAWVSFFTYDPRVGAEIFADWVRSLPNLQWLNGQTPVEVLRQGDRVTGVRFEDFTIEAQIVLDGTELGDLLALGEVPYRWGWDFQADWAEPSAPEQPNTMTQTYPVQAPTWVFVMQDFGLENPAPEIPAPPLDSPEAFAGTWDGYGSETFLNYGRLPGNRFMLNFPQQGNDYGVKLDRLVAGVSDRQEFLQEARWYAQSYARFLQQALGNRYGLAEDVFPHGASLGGGGYALHPYFRESRRLQGVTTIIEPDILPLPGGQVAPLPMDAAGRMEAIALGNYANDHHYPGFDFALKPKSIRWGGRWTGTPFTIPYRSLLPEQVDGLLVCEKNISVSHIANGATRLQPVVLGIGQAAGMAAALCVEHNCQPRALPVQVLQTALIADPIAPVAIAPLFNLTPAHPDWPHWQNYYLEHPEAYPLDGYCPLTPPPQPIALHREQHSFSGTFQRQGEQDYTLVLTQPGEQAGQALAIVTLYAEVNAQLASYPDRQAIQVWGRLNRAGNWVLVERCNSHDEMEHD